MKPTLWQTKNRGNLTRTHPDHFPKELIPWPFPDSEAPPSPYIIDNPRQCTPDDLDGDGIPNVIDPHDSILDPDIGDTFNRAKRWRWLRDPIILDLDGNGLETVGLASNIHFDHDGDGVLTKTGWVGKDDALLVWDRNANGSIDTGAELFGDFTELPDGTLAPNGFAALAALDSNGDGILDASDPAFAELKLWRDASQDGVSQGGEFITLADAGIVSLNLAHTLKNQGLPNGNTLSREGGFTRADGTSGGMGEFKLAIDTFDTQFADPVAVPEELKSLPNMGGAGNVRELQQAAAGSGDVAALLAQFQSATTRAAQRTLLDQLITAWAATAGMDSLERRAAGKYRILYEAFGDVRRAHNQVVTQLVQTDVGSAEDSGFSSDALGNALLNERYRTLIAEWRRKLGVLEAFNGQYFFNLPQEIRQTDSANWGLWVGIGSGGGTFEATPTLHILFSQPQLDLLQQAYDSLTESVYGSLVLQTRLKPYLDAIELVIDDQGIRLDAAGLNQMLANTRAANAESYLGDVLDLDKYAGSFLSGTNWDGLADFDTLVDILPRTADIQRLLDEFKVRLLTGGNDITSFTDKADIVLAADGNDTLYGSNGNDRLFGQAGNDRLLGGNGDDLLSGGAGDDALFGEQGADTYVFGRGHGNDTISDYAENGIRRDTVRFIGLASVDLQITADIYDNLIFSIKDTGETLSVPAEGRIWGPNGVGQYVFDDGTVWSHDDVLKATVTMVATDGNDLIYGSSASEAIAGLGGDDTLIGRAGDDVIDSEEGNDVLIGASGRNWVWLHDRWIPEPVVSANGNDTYLFGRGDGRDMVIDGDSTAGNRDTLRFKEGVLPADVRLIRNGNDLVLMIRDSADQVAIKQYFDEDWRGGNGNYLIEHIAFVDGTVWSFTDVQAILFVGSEEAETITGSRLADHLFGQGGNDTLNGREGIDHLNGGDGDDVLLGGSGHDFLDGGAGNDVLRGGSGLIWDGQAYNASGERDTYYFGRTNGHDIIIEDSWLLDQIDRIVLKPGVAPDDIRLERVRSVDGWKIEDDLRLTIRDTGDTLTVKRQFDASNRHAVEEIVFADGTVWDMETIIAHVLIGESDNDELRGFSDRDDVILGGAGNDRLVGISGYDDLDGGAGDDTLEGGSGSDIYRFGTNGGRDEIVEGHDYPWEQDVLELAEGIGPEDVTVRWTMQGGMAVTLPDGSRVTVRNQANEYMSADGYGIEALIFADGTEWDRDAMAARAIAGTDGDDFIVGNYRSDTLEGGAGYDRFQDRGSYDTYRFGIGDGRDTVEDSEGRILFKPGIGQNDVDFSRDGSDLIATIGVSGDSIRITGWLDSQQRIDSFEFDNGAKLNVSDVLAKLNISEGAEILYGSPADETLAGTDKNSILYGREGNDFLTGAAGSDELHGEDGDDILDGGAGRDWLYGGAGLNSYIVAPGTGLDVAVASSASVASDTVVFAPGVRPEDLSVQMGEQSGWWDSQPGDVGYLRMVVGIGGDDALVVQNAGGDDLGRGAIQRFRFADGTELSLADMIALADGGRLGWQQGYWGDPASIVGSQGDDFIRLYDWSRESVTVQARGNDDRVELAIGNDVVSAGSGNDTVYTSGGDDLVAGEKGNDSLETGSGNDVFVFNYGDGMDELIAGGGTDTLSFGATVTPGMVSAALDGDGRVVLFIDGGAGGRLTLMETNVDNLPGDLERMQFIAADGNARIFDLAGWLEANSASLTAANLETPLAFDGSGFELTGTVAPAGGLEAVAYAQSGNLFATANLSNNEPTDGNDLIYGTSADDTLDAMQGDDIVLGLAGHDTIDGGDGNDLLDGGDGDDLLNGGAGDDEIHGGWGADRIAGGGGRDKLFGGWGGDTYLFQPGDGEIIIDDGHQVLGWNSEGGWIDNEKDAAEWGGEPVMDEEPNVLVFGPGIRPEDLHYSVEGDDLVIEFAGRPGDRVVLRGFDAGRETQTRSVDIIRFDDGTEIAAGSIEPPGKTETGGDDGAELSGTQYADTLIGGDGDDILDGMGGGDRLIGGAGSDTYRIHLQWGSQSPSETFIVETWREWDYNSIELTGAVDEDALSLEFDGRDLLLRLNEGGDKVRFVGFDPRSPGMQAPVTEIQLPWGNSVDFSELLARGVRIVGTTAEDGLSGTALADQIEGLEADDTLAGGAGGDIYVVDYDGGTDTVIDTEEGDAPNVLVLPDGTSIDDVRLSFDAAGFLILDLDNTGNRIRLSGFDPANPLGPRAVERFRFGLYGDEIGYEELIARGFDIVGTEEGDSLRGTILADRVFGDAGNDLLEATPGGDWLAGEAGNDSYVVNLGDGEVVIDDIAEADAGNALRFGPGIEADSLRNNLRFADDGSGGHFLLISYGGPGDVVRLARFDPEDTLGAHAVDRIEFDDGTVVDYATLVSWTFVVEGDSAGNALRGTNASDRLYGYDSDDVLDAGEGDDVLTGGAGNDALHGGAGLDTYVVNLGDGEDVIEDSSEAGLGNVLSFGEGIAREDVSVAEDGDDMLIHYGQGLDMVRVRNYASTDGGTTIDTFEFSDGSTVTLREFMNRAPEVANPIDDQILLEDASFSLTLPENLFFDVDGDAVLARVAVAGYESFPAWLHYDSSSRTLYGTPENPDVGEFDIVVEGTDALGASAYHSFHVTVQNTNDAPEAMGIVTGQQATEDATFSFTVPRDAFRDIDAGDVLSFMATQENGEPLPDWLSFDAQTLIFSGTPENRDVGSLQVRIMATDLAGAQASQTFSLDVTNVNDAPQVASAIVDQQATEDALFVFAIPGDAFKDIDAGDTISYTATQENGDPLPDWLSFDAQTQLFSGTPANGDVGSMQLRITATDLAGAQASQTFSLNVANVNDAPMADSPLLPQRVLEDTPFNYALPADSFRDVDIGDMLILSATLENGAPPAGLARFQCTNPNLLRYSGKRRCGYAAGTRHSHRQRRGIGKPSVRADSRQHQ